MNIDFSKLKFQTNWASATTIVTLLVAVITLYTTNKGLQDKVDGLEKSNTSLSGAVKTMGETVSTLKGSQEIINNAITQFMQNPPAEIKYRVERLEEIMERTHGNISTASSQPAKPFENKTPGK